MRFYIEESVVCGFKNPLLIFKGSIESKFDKILICKKNGDVLHTHNLKKTKFKSISFAFEYALPSSLVAVSYDVYAENNESMEKFHTIHTSALTRFFQKHVQIGNKLNEIGSKEVLSTNKIEGLINPFNDNQYHEWISKQEKYLPIQEYAYNPLISIVMPVYNVDSKYLSECIDSILKQTYTNFEICIADDCSNKQETLDTLKEYETLDSRVKVFYREKNGHISNATNSALSIASGDFIGLLDNDDVLHINALNEVVHALNKNENLDFIYSDEDKLSLEGERSDPHFKSDFCLDKFYGGNFICHFSVIRKSIIEAVGGFKIGVEGAQDFDLFLRITNKTDKIYHIPKILYHWRMIPGSTALDSSSKNYAGEAGKKGLLDLFNSKGIDVEIDVVVNTHYFVKYLMEKEEKIDVILYVSSNNIKYLKELENKMKYVYYSNYRIVSFTKDYDGSVLTSLKSKINFIKTEGNPVHKINEYLKQSDAVHFLFLQENYMPSTFDSLELMAGYSQQPEVGVVGAKVLNKRKRVIEYGYVINEFGKCIPTNDEVLQNEYGIYGNLLVPSNYTVLENKAFMISKDKLEKVNWLNESLSVNKAYYDLHVKMKRSLGRNVILPKVMFENNGKLNQDNKNDLPILDHEYIDKYYNENLSNKKAFAIDQVEIKQNRTYLKRGA